MYVGPHVTYPLFSPNVNETWTFVADFRKIFKYNISWKSVQRERSCSMPAGGRAGGQTNMMKKTIAFRLLRTRLKTV